MSAEMNTFCATCHGDFHGVANTGSGPFVRHPTDEAVTDDWATPTVDVANNPWGFTSTAGLSTGVAYTATGGMVMCVSCHRAHGSGQSDNLRFTYANQVAGSAGVGCQGCHNK
jgi:predicted CXXCH cytochrome family protein